MGGKGVGAVRRLFSVSSNATSTSVTFGEPFFGLSAGYVVGGVSNCEWLSGLVAQGGGGMPLWGGRDGIGFFQPGMSGRSGLLVSVWVCGG
jgi:hypothetical protein